LKLNTESKTTTGTNTTPAQRNNKNKITKVVEKTSREYLKRTICFQWSDIFFERTICKDLSDIFIIILKAFNNGRRKKHSTAATAKKERIIISRIGKCTTS